MADRAYADAYWKNHDGTYSVPGGATVSADQLGPYLDGGAGGAGDYSPQGLAAAFERPPVTLPRAEEAKGALRDLQLGGVRGLETLLGADPNAGRARMEAAFYDPMAEQIDYDTDRAIRDANEVYGGRNVLTSTIPMDYMRAPLERERMQAKERARSNAITSAGSEMRADTNSQLQTLGAAFNTGTAGMQADANVESASAARGQQATQAGYQTGLQREENARNREQQATLQREGFTNARDIASNSMLMGGLGAGIGGLASLFGPQGLGTAAAKKAFGF
jgi:hypothetical protein